MYNWWCIFFTCSGFFVCTLRPFLTFLLTKLRMKNPIKMNPSRINTFVFYFSLSCCCCCCHCFLPSHFNRPIATNHKANSFTYCSHTLKNFQRFSPPSISYLNCMYARLKHQLFFATFVRLPVRPFSTNKKCFYTHGLLFMHFHMP